MKVGDLVRDIWNKDPDPTLGLIVNFEPGGNYLGCSRANVIFDGEIRNISINRLEIISESR